MATQTHKQLATGQMSSSVSQAYIAPLTTTSYIKGIVFYNSNNASETVEVYVSGSATQNKILKRIVASDETLEWALNYPLIFPASQSLFLKTTTSTVVNNFIYGMEETA